MSAHYRVFAEREETIARAPKLPVEEPREQAIQLTRSALEREDHAWKPLLYHFLRQPFTRGYLLPKSSRPNHPGSSLSSMSTVWRTEAPTGGAARTRLNHCDLFRLSPSVREIERSRGRGGAPLTETDALQAKHSAEYKFIVTVLTAALSRIVSEHENLRQGESELSSYYFDITDSSSSCGWATDSSDADVSDLFSAFEYATSAKCTLSGYVRHLVKYSYASPSTFLVACIYIDRLLILHPSLLILETNVYGLLLTAVRLASKILDTRTLASSDFANAGNVLPEELNMMEFAMVRLLDLDVYVSPEEFYTYSSDLIAAADGTKASILHTQKRRQQQKWSPRGSRVMRRSLSPPVVDSTIHAQHFTMPAFGNTDSGASVACSARSVSILSHQQGATLCSALHPAGLRVSVTLDHSEFTTSSLCPLSMGEASGMNMGASITLPLPQHRSERHGSSRPDLVVPESGTFLPGVCSSSSVVPDSNETNEGGTGHRRVCGRMGQSSFTLPDVMAQGHDLRMLPSAPHNGFVLCTSERNDIRKPNATVSNRRGSLPFLPQTQCPLPAQRTL